MHPAKNAYRSVTPTAYTIRCVVVVVMMAAAATFLHINNYRPKQTFLSCDRPCHHLDWPMICRVKLTLEVFQSLSKSCGDCLHNETACLANHCISVDGQKRGILTANRQLPGPSIQVCENDILVVDVINRLPGKTAAVHWRGQSQIETPYMDGAPLITQCPIPSYTTFQYKFRASTPGTHLWHAHAGGDVTNGIFGSLIVRQADLRDPHRALYDVDDPNHVILVTHWRHSSETVFDDADQKSAILLVNGRGRQLNGPSVPFSTFTVVPGRRHRFRVANAAGIGTCPITISVDGHPLLLIALDGHPVNPVHVTSITLAKGERADFILKASKSISSYWINVRTVKECGSKSITGAAILQYKGSASSIPIASVENADEVPSDSTRLTTNPGEECSNSDILCVTEVQAVRKMPAPLVKPNVDITLYLPINYEMQNRDFTEAGVSWMETKVLNVANATFTYPSSPLLTQGDDVSQDMLCSVRESSDPRQNEEIKLISPRCSRVDKTASGTCECVHIREIPLGATVEIILLDQAGLNDLVYHLHGHNFYIVGARKFDEGIQLRELKELNEKGLLFSRNLDCAPLKDTVVVPKYGAVALRFKADNPGFWMLRDEHARDWTRGLDVVLKIGETSDMTSAPEDFPKCGSFVGPDYFLI